MNLILFSIAGFTLMCYGNLIANPDRVFDENSNIFKGRMIIALLITIFLIIFERVVNRTNTFKIEKKISMDKNDNSYFSEQ